MILIEIPQRKLESELAALAARGDAFALGAAYALQWLLHQREVAPHEVPREAEAGPC